MSYPARPRASARRAVSLLAAIVAALVLVPASAAMAEDYIAMGDSYASGTGTKGGGGTAAYYEGCERSIYAYSYLNRPLFGTYKSIACGGARTQNVLDSQVSALSAATKQVTISIGGNDAGFSDVVTDCALPQPFWSNACEDAIADARSYISNTLPGRLNLVYSKIRERAPGAVVNVVGYPRLFNGDDCNAGTFFSGDEMSRLNATADLLSSVTRTRARAHGFSYIDPRQAFIGHAVCDDVEWLNGLVALDVGESFHPNRAGHSAGFRPMAAAAMQAAPAPDAVQGKVGRIAFTSRRDGNPEVYAVNSDGGFPANLTQHAAADITPAWSPDGTKVAFASDRDGDNEIYVVDGDGSGLAKLTSNSSDDQEPAWSPNGAYIAFRSDRGGDNEIYRMTASGASETALTSNSVSDFAPDWSPDGAEIVFQRYTSGSGTGRGNEIIRANSSGQGDVNLTNNTSSYNDGRPAWSPDGNTIAFHSNRDGDFDVFTMTRDGSSETQRVDVNGNDENPSYSPTGGSIAFHTNRHAGGTEIYTMTPTGGSQTRRTTSAGDDSDATWQADSTPPVARITSGPSGPVSDARPAFTFDASEQGSTLGCRIDGGAFTTCGSTYRPASPLAEGEHTFAVRATDHAGNPAAPTERTFVVDTVAPEVEIDCPSVVLLNESAVATVTATDATSGLGSLEDPSGEHDLETSVPGTRTFSAQAIDLAGNETTTECSYEVVYPEPEAPVLGDGESPNAGVFALDWTPVAGPEYPVRYTVERRDAATRAEREDVFTGLADPRAAFTSEAPEDEGTWVYRVRAIDAEHDTDTGWSPASQQVKVDRSAPHAPKLTADREPEFAGDGGWFADGVDVTTSDEGDPQLRDGSDPSGVDPASVAAVETLTETADLTRTVRDLVGNESAETTQRFQVDAGVPSLELTCPQTAELLDDASVIVAASDEESGSGLADDPSGEVAVDTSTAGRRTITRTATDRVGHSRTESCTVLVVYPTPGAPALDEGATPNAGDFRLAWTASAPAGHPLRYVLQRRDAAEGSDWETVEDGLEDARRAFTAGERADEGTWVYRVRGVDVENDLTTPWSEESEPVVVDQAGPRAPSVTADRDPEYAGDGGWFADTVDVTTTDQGDPELRDGSEPSGVDPASVAAVRTLTESATVTRTVRDLVGNESAETARTFQVDADAPSLELTCPGTVELLDDVAVEVAASDTGSGLSEDPSGTVPVDTSQVGRKTVRRTATDNVGHTTERSCEILVVYPTPGAPEVTEGGSPNAGDYELGWTASAPDGYPLRYEVQRRDASADAAWKTVRDGLAAARLAFAAGERADEGTWTYPVRGVDGENDAETPWSEHSAAVVVDQTAPAAPTVATQRAPEFAGDGGWWKDSVAVETSDNGDPDLRDGSAPSGVDPASVAGPQLLEETTTVRRTVSDRVGNESAASELAVQVDTRRPELEMVCPESVLLNGAGVVTVAASDDESGLDRDPSEIIRIDTSEVGMQTFERTATDRVGHVRTESCEVLVRYGYDGLLKPVDRDGSSVFKRGSTVPLKLELTDSGGRSVDDAEVTVELERITTTADGDRVEETVEATSTNGKPFRYTDGHYQFNLSTKPLDTGTWDVVVRFDDGTEHRTRITLR